MLETEGEIASLEANAFTPAQYDAVHTFRHYLGNCIGQLGVVFGASIVENLNMQTLAWPVQACRRSGNPYGEEAFVTDRQLYQDVR